MSFYPIHSTVRYIPSGKVMVVLDHYGDPGHYTLNTDLEGDVNRTELEPVELFDFYMALADQEPSEQLIQDYAKRLGQHFRDRRNIPNNTYDPSHPWYYHLGGGIFDVNEITGTTNCENLMVIPKTPEKLRLVRGQYLESLAEDEQGYLEAIKNLDRGNINSCTSVSLKHNHISFNKARINFLDDHCGIQESLF